MEIDYEDNLAVLRLTAPEARALYRLTYNSLRFLRHPDWDSGCPFNRQDEKACVPIQEELCDQNHELNMDQNVGVTLTNNQVEVLYSLLSVNVEQLVDYNGNPACIAGDNELLAIPLFCLLTQ